MTIRTMFSPFQHPVWFSALVVAVTVSVLAAIAACAPRHPPVEAPTVETIATTSSVTPLVVLAPQHPPAIRLRSRGTNLSGGEFAPTKLPGTYGVDYLYPPHSDVDFFVARGMNRFRIGFLHERMQPSLRGPIDEIEWKRLLDLVTYARSKGAVVAIVPHNSGRFRGVIVSEVEFGDFWGRIATRLKDTDGVVLNLTNEPHGMPTEQWVALANAALKEIRRVGFTGLVQVPGSAWTGAGHWNEKFDGYTPNSVAMLKVVDPINNMLFETHLYLDENADGTKECVSPTIGVERLAGFTAWLRANGRLGAVGEVGAINTPMCKLAVTNTLKSIEQDYDVWMSWSWWSAGVWNFGGSGNYPLSIGPTADGQPEKPQLGWLLPFLACPRPAL